jgi:hypothetical protein
VYHSLDFWYRLLVAYAIVLGVEAPLLLFVASLRRRPWYEQALALLPAGGFGLGLYLARNVLAALANWQSYVAFQETHYSPEYWRAFATDQRADLQAVITSAQWQAWMMGALTLAMLMGGWVLLLRWASPPRRVAPLAPVATHPPGEVIATESDEGKGTLEITIEPIEKEQR